MPFGVEGGNTLHLRFAVLTSKFLTSHAISSLKKVIYHVVTLIMIERRVQLTRIGIMK